MKKLFLLLAVVGMTLTACSEGGVDDDINNGGGNTEQPGGGEDGGEDNPDIPADKTQAIQFHDRNTKLICTIFWDKNGDGELSYEEAAAVTHLDDTAFKDSSIVLFNELKYFTSLKKIGDYAFSGCRSLRSIAIPDSVILIGKEAFRDCINLEWVYISDIAAWCNISFGDYYANPLCYVKHLYLNDELVTDLTIPDNVTAIGKHAFENCRILKSVTIGNGVTSIGDYAFAYCSSLQSVTIGNGVTTIGDFAFDGCSILKSVYISDIAAWCNISFGNYDANPLYHAEHLYLNDELVTDLTIPDSVTTIGFGAFYGCSSLTSVTIPDSVTEIGDYTFYECSSLQSVTIGNSVTTIGYEAFAWCSSLTSVTIPDSVTTIGNYAFRHCSSLTEFKGKFASEDARCLIIDGTLNSFAPAGVTEYTIPDSVTAIGNYAFYECSSLTSITIPDNVTTIGWSAFRECSSLTEFKGKFASEDGRCLIIDGTLESFAPAGVTEYTIPDSVTAIGDSAFEYCSSLTSVTIPNSVTEIGDSAFYECSSLTSITIPDSVTTIGILAFYECSSLESVYCKPITPPSIGYNVFDNNASGRRIYVPAESVEAYKTASNWRYYASDIVGYEF